MKHRISNGFWILAVLSVIIIFFNLGGLPFFDPDEPVYAETPKEMIAFNDYVSPRIYGEFWYDKPPMYYWLVAASFKLFGINEFAARFPSALLAIICIFSVYYFASRIFNQRAGFAGAIVLLTSLEFYYLSKAAVTDMTLLVTLTICLLGFLAKKYYLFYVFAALATVTKGPIGLVFPGAIVFLYLLVTGRWSQIKTMHVPLGLLIYTIIAFPWYGVMYAVHGMDFINTFLGFHNITRFTSPEHPEGALWYYFIPVLILGFFPWTAILFQAVWSSLKNSSYEFSQLLFLNIWAAFIFIFFSISQTKLVSYILPMFVPLAMIVGWYIDRIWDQRRINLLSWPVVATALTIVICIGMLYGVQAMPVLRIGVIMQIVILVLMLLGIWLFYWQRDFGRMMMVKVAAVTLSSLVLFGVMFPQAAPNFTSRDIAKLFLQNYDGASQVYISKFLHPGFTFYTNVYGTEMQMPSEAISVNLIKPGTMYFVITQNDYNRLIEEDKQKLEIIAAAADKYLLIKR